MDGGFELGGVARGGRFILLGWTGLGCCELVLCVGRRRSRCRVVSLSSVSRSKKKKSFVNNNMSSRKLQHAQSQKRQQIKGKTSHRVNVE